MSSASAPAPLASTFTVREIAAIEAVAQWVVRLGLVTPAILFLESMQPMNRVGAAAMTFFHPLADALMNTERYSALRDAFERRQSIEFLLQRIEALDHVRGR